MTVLNKPNSIKVMGTLKSSPTVEKLDIKGQRGFFCLVLFFGGFWEGGFVFGFFVCFFSLCCRSFFFSENME